MKIGPKCGFKSGKKSLLIRFLLRSDLVTYFLTRPHPCSNSIRGKNPSTIDEDIVNICALCGGYEIY